ncbi:MAG TPA: hypothetical protein VGJ86_06160 [Acidimicrobiales bacterium]|jgi:hypothetical protein
MRTKQVGLKIAALATVCAAGATLGIVALPETASALPTNDYCWSVYKNYVAAPAGSELKGFWHAVGREGGCW